MRIIEPGRHGNCVVGVEDVRCGRVVQYNGICYRAAKLGQVLKTGSEQARTKKNKQYLDIVPSMVITAFPKQSVFHDLVNVQFIENGISVLRHGGSV